MRRERIGAIVLRAYPPAVRLARGPEMLSMLLDAGAQSRLAFARECGSLIVGGLRERAHVRRGRILFAAAGMIVAVLALGALAIGLKTSLPLRTRAICEASRQISRRACGTAISSLSQNLSRRHWRTSTCRVGCATPRRSASTTTLGDIPPHICKPRQLVPSRVSRMGTHDDSGTRSARTPDPPTDHGRSRLVEPPIRTCAPPRGPTGRTTRPRSEAPNRRISTTEVHPCCVTDSALLYVET